MPDGIAAFQKDGKTYLVTANEGDSRQWGNSSNEDERNFKNGADTSPSGAITADLSGLTGKVTFFDSNAYDGLDISKDYLFGGRSFTVYEANEDGIHEVFTSGDDFEALTYRYLPDYYNCSNDNATLDDRSGKKGPEPESVTVGTVNGRTYAFVALERTGGIMVYDVSNPSDAQFVNYINSRDFTATVPGSEVYDNGTLDKWITGGDVAPEVLAFLSASESATGTPLLLAACEVSGTVAVYQLDPAAGVPSQGGTGGSFGSSSSTITAVATEHGTLTISPKEASQGDTVTVTVSPDTGYRLDNITVSDTAGANIPLTRINDSCFTFSMPKTAVTVTASFRAATEQAFTDVADSDWYAEAVNYVSANGLMEGIRSGIFDPTGTTTRAMLVTVLYRLEGSPNAVGNSDFSDVASDAWYADAVTWASENGIVDGYGHSQFGPSDPVTREQAASILYRYTCWKHLDGEVQGLLDGFADGGTVSAWAREATAWAVGVGLLNGRSGKKLEPQGLTTRAETAALLMRFQQQVR